MAGQAKLSALFKEAKEKTNNPPEPLTIKKEHIKEAPVRGKDEEKGAKKRLGSSDRPPKVTRRHNNKGKKEGNSVDPRNPRTVFIGNLPLSLKKKDVVKLVSPYGTVESLRQRSAAVSPGKLPVGVARKLGKQLTGNSTNFYVVMATEESANACLELNGRDIDGRHIRVDLATPTNDTQNSVFVGNVPFDADEEKLRKVFESCGLVDGVRLIKDTRTGINKGFAYVKFKDRAAVLFACKQNEKIHLESRKLRVFRCRSDKSKFQTKFGGVKSHPGKNKKLLKSFQPVAKRRGKNEKKKTKMRRKEKAVKRKEKSRKRKSDSS